MNLSRLDPRVKLALLLVLSTAALTTERPALLLTWLGLTALLLLLGGISAGQLLQKTKTILKLIASLFVLQCLFNRNGDPWLSLPPPKSTGREAYGAAYVDEIMRKGRETGLADIDILATATRFTAECVALAIERFCPVRPDVLILGGGGARNRTLVCHIRDAVSAPVFRNEDLGYNSDAKEAIAFAILANECVHDSCNNLPSATGARHPVVMGKITL